MPRAPHPPTTRAPSLLECIDEHGGDGSRADLCGQEANGTVWSIAKMNMLLHDISTADLRNDDTLAEPEHVEGGELMRFDRALSNPPFSINAGSTDTDRAGQQVWEAQLREKRFRYGEVPLASKKADLVFLLHMVAALRDGGQLATVINVQHLVGHSSTRHRATAATL